MNFVNGVKLKKKHPILVINNITSTNRLVALFVSTMQCKEILEREIVRLFIARNTVGVSVFSPRYAG